MATVTAELTEGTVTTISDGRHQWSADEPPHVGGTDTGPNPYELLLGSLAACTCITLSLYCRHKGIHLTKVSASFSHARIHAKDCEDCESDVTGFIDRVESHIVIEGDFDDAARKRVAEVAVRCPVHKTLTNGIRFKDSVQVETGSRA